MYQIFADQICIYDDTVPELMFSEAVPWTRQIDPSDYTGERIFINDSGAWQAGTNARVKSIFVPIPEGATGLTLTPNTYSYYALLTTNSHVAGEDADFASGYSGRIRFEEEVVVTQLPSDAAYLWIYTHTSTTSGDLTPTYVGFNGVNYASPSPRRGAINPKLSLSAGAAGTLELTLVPGGAGYDEVARLTTTLHVMRDGVEIWQGRVLQESIDIFKCRHLTCEGALAYLNDTVYLHEGNFRGSASVFLGLVLAEHNSRVPYDRQIQLGTITASAASDIYVEYSMAPALDIILGIANDNGGIMRVRNSGGTLYLDWLGSYITGSQSIEFGRNLLDFTRDYDVADFATAVLAVGGSVDVQQGDETIQVPVVSGWVTNSAALTTFGRIERVISVSDTTDQTVLYAEALRYLNSQFDRLTLNLSALDLHMLDESIKAFDLLETVHVSSWAHGLEKDFAVTGLAIPLDNPSGTAYTLGDASIPYKRPKRPMTQQMQEQTQELQDEISSGVSDAMDYAEEKSAEAIQVSAQALTEARAEIDATMSGLTEGYVFIDTNGTTTQGIYITDSPIHSVSEITSSMHVWKWSMTGLGYSDDGGRTWKTAMTFDGKINADMVLTGLLMAQYIKLYGDLAVYPDGSSTVPGGYLGYGSGLNGDGDVTPGIHMYVDNGNTEIIVTSSGARLSFGNYHLYVSSSGVVITGGGGLDCPVLINGNLTVNGTINGTVI